MNDRRGHRRLRLCSRKHYQAKPRKRRVNKEQSLVVSIPLSNISMPFEVTYPLSSYKEQSLVVSIPLSNISIPFKVTYPLSSYTDGQVVSLNLLHNRLERCGFLPSGMIFFVLL